MYMHVNLLQLCPTLCDSVDCSLLGSSVHRIFQTRKLENIATSYTKGFSWPRDWTQISWVFFIIGGFLTAEPLENPNLYQFSSVQSLSHVWLFVTPGTAAHQASLSITNSQSLPKLMSIESVMPSNHRILCCALLFPP